MSTHQEPEQLTQPAAALPSAPPPAPPVRLDDSHAQACYANFCRVTGTPEEVILDLALNPSPFDGATQTLPVGQRIVLNYFTAKRLLTALQMTVQRHEQAFGVLETDISKRVRGQRGSAS